jgi:hypothetical protein
LSDALEILPNSVQPVGMVLMLPALVAMPTTSRSPSAVPLGKLPSVSVGVFVVVLATLTCDR